MYYLVYKTSRTPSISSHSKELFRKKSKMLNKVLLFLTICQGIGLFLMSGVKSEAVVQLEDTEIWGKEITFENKKCNQYLGIPYAEPPVGPLRFDKPVPLTTFPDRYVATDPAPACRQYTEATYPWYFNEENRSEDCLYMNIWTPVDASPENPKPVLFWIHSGQFKFGSNSPDFYSGEHFATLGDIVLVTCNYRLGMFGFLSSDTDEAPGNVGLWDIKEALKWVNKYISNFGGDPSQITIGGQSSAAVIVGYFTLNEDAQSLYSRIIMHSGSPVNFGTDYKQRNEELGLKIAKRVGCAKDGQTKLDSTVIECLKDVQEEELEDAENKMTPNSPASFHPIMKDEFMPQNPRKSIMDGKFQCKPLLIGNNRDEGSVILPLLDADSFGVNGEKASKVNGGMVTKILNTIMKVYPDLSALPGVPPLPDFLSAVTPALDVDPLLSKLPDLKSAMPVPAAVDGMPNVGSLMASSFLGGAPPNPHCMRHQLHSTLGDVTVLCPSVYFAEQCADQDNDVYYYYFVHQSSDSPYAPWMGATHFSEMPYVFGKPLRKPGYTQAEKELSRRMIGYWSNFVKTGKPDPSWPKYSKENNIYKVLDTKNGTKPYGKGPHKTNCGRLRVAYKML